MILKERVMEMNRNLIKTSLLMIFMSIPVGYSMLYLPRLRYILWIRYMLSERIKFWIQTNSGILLQSNLTIERAEMWKW